MGGQARIGVGQLSLGRRIVASVAVGLVLILSLFGFVALWTVNESTEAAYRERVGFAQVLASRVDDVLGQSRVTLERAAVDFRLEPGQTLTEAQRRQLTDLRLRIGAFATIAVTDVDGNTWVEPRSAWTTADSRHHDPSVQLVLGGGEPQTTEFVPDGHPTKVFARIAVPLRDTNGHVVGVLMAELEPGHPTMHLLPSASSASGMHAQLLTGNTTAEPSYVAEHRALLASFVESRTAGFRIHETAPGARFPSHVVAYSPVSELPSWGITVEQPQDVALEIPRRLERRLALFGLAALVLVAIYAWLDVRRVVGPLKGLTAMAERFAAGQLDQPFLLNRTDELGVLARAFETMRQQLRSSLAEVAEWNRSALLEPNRVIALVVGKARDLFGSEVAGLGLVEEGSGDLTWRLLAGGTNRLRQIRLRSSEGMAGEVIVAGCPRAIADLHLLPADGIATMGLPISGLRSALTVPLQSQGQAFGVLMVGGRAAATFSDEQISLLSRLADQAAVALENARLYRKVQSLAALEERERIAREMHDGLGQVLGYVNTKTLAVSRLLEVGKIDEARDQVAELEAATKEVYADVREAILGLRTTLGPEHDFLAALHRYLEGFEQQSGIAVEFEALAAEEKLALPFGAEIQLLRIVQEALANVRKHAAASRAAVRLVSVDGALQLTVEDDGRGFDPARRTPEGWPRFGLQTMRERAVAIGGTLEIESRDGGGTQVTVIVPQNHHEEQEADDVPDTSPVGR